MTVFLITAAAVLAIGMAGVIIGCERAPLWDSECEYLFSPKISGGNRMKKTTADEICTYDENEAEEKKAA